MDAMSAFWSDMDATDGREGLLCGVLISAAVRSSRSLTSSRADVGARREADLLGRVWPGQVLAVGS